MDVRELRHIVWCDLELVLLKIHSSSPWDTKMVRTSTSPDLAKPVVNVYICPEHDVVFDPPTTYREKMMRQGSYRGHHFGPPARLKSLDEANIALAHPDPGQVIWSYVVKYVLTLRAIEAGMLHLKGGAVAYKGSAFLILGRGGSGKTEVVKALCAQGAKLMANTHLLVDRASALGVKSNMRVRDRGVDVYVPASEEHGFDVHDGWLPVAAVVWVQYRTDGSTIVEKLPLRTAKANLRYFAEAISNWEIKEDIADYCRADPLAFAEDVNRVDVALDKFCDRHDVYYVNLDIFSDEGMASLLSLMESKVVAR